MAIQDLCAENQIGALLKIAVQPGSATAAVLNQMPEGQIELRTPQEIHRALANGQLVDEKLKDAENMCANEEMNLRH
jgi:hypothetical protein